MPVGNIRSGFYLAFLFNFSFVRSAFKYLANIGVKPADEFLERRKVQVSNYLLVFIFLLNLINAFLYGLYYYQELLFWDALSSIGFAGLGFWMQQKGIRVPARHAIVALSMISLANISFHFGEELGTHYYMFFLIIVYFLLFDKLWIIAGYSLLNIICFFVFEACFAENPLTPDPGIGFSYYPNAAAAFLMFTLIVYVFKSEATDYQKIVEAQNKDLSSLTVKLMFQKDEALIATNQLKKKTKVLEQQNQSITESLRLASLVQSESLPLESQIFNGLKSGMLLYRPMHIVSGDFYWAKSTMQGQIIVVADCIGHGVPGGMMAVLSANLISQIVEEHGKTFPSDILEALYMRLRRRIKQDTLSDVGDGMDIAVCLIQGSRVSFASASRSLVKVDASGNVNTYSGNRFQLASGKEQPEGFETIELEAAPGDRYYMFTDGVVDQFSQQTGKKLGTKRFTQELASLFELPLTRQKTEIEAFLKSWQGSERQTDDMLLIGFEIEGPRG